MRGKSRKILIGMVVVVVLLGAWYGVSLARAKARLRAAYAALEQDGRPMDVNDVLPPEVPDAQNAAVLYARAVALVKAESVDDKNLLEYLGKRAGPYLNGSLETDERAEFERLVQQDVITEAQSLLQQANQRPACRFDRPDRITLHEDPPIATDLRNLAVVLGARARLADEQGRSHAAWEIAGVQLGLADKVRSDPLIPGPWVKFGLIGLACRTVKTLCEIAPPDEAACQRLENLLRDLDALEPFVRYVDAERLAVGERVFSLPDDELFDVLLRDPWSGGGATPSVLNRLSFRFTTFGPRFVADHASYLQVSRQTIRLLEGPFMSYESAAFQEVRDLAGRYPLTSRLAVFIYGLKSIHCRMANDVRTTRAGLALLEYKQAHGAFPETLTALNLEGLVDPYNQEPLHYRAEGAGFIVYSVAEDLKDNDGQPQQRRSSDPRQKKDPQFDRGWCFGQTETGAEDEEP